MKAGFSGLLISTALLVGAPAAPAADTAPSRAATDKLSGVRTHIAEKRWQAAIDELKAVNDTGSADWNNLMGYSLRKLACPITARPRSTTPRRFGSIRSIAVRSNTRASCT
jgi:hypothetical protein